MRIPGKIAGESYNKVMLNIFKGVTVTRYLCTFCGFTEEWIDNEKDLEKIAKKYSAQNDYNEFV